MEKKLNFEFTVYPLQSTIQLSSEYVGLINFPVKEIFAVQIFIDVIVIFLR